MSCIDRLRATLAAALLLLFAGSAWAAPAGTVVGLSGDCVVEHAGARNPAALAQGIEVGDTVEVPDGGKMKLRMADGSVVSVAASSRMTVTAYGVTDAGQRQDAQLTLQQGLLRVEVTPTTSAPARFEVETAVGTAAVRSTDWFVEANGDDMQVHVLSGAVEMTSRGTRHAVMIPAHSGSQLHLGRDPLPPHQFHPATIAALTGRTQVAERVSPGARPGAPPGPRPPGVAGQPSEAPGNRDHPEHHQPGRHEPEHREEVHPPAGAYDKQRLEERHERPAGRPGRPAHAGHHPPIEHERRHEVR